LNYKEINDYELIYEVRESNEDSYNLLIKKYSTLIKRIADEYYRKCKRFKVEYDDLVQEGYFGLFQALDNYNEETSLFYTFASLCIRREMERLIKSYSRNKHMLLNNAISLSEPIDDEKDTFIEDTIPSNYDIEDTIISDTNIRHLISLKNDMPFEMACVYELRMNRFNNIEISILLDIPKKKVEKYVYKIKQKVSKKVCELK
jgi:RNA polymerase sporulation-specific sigma factor